MEFGRVEVSKICTHDCTIQVHLSPLRCWFTVASSSPRQALQHSGVQELCESRDGRPGLSVLTSLTVSVDVKQYWTVLRHRSQCVPNMWTDIRGHEALLHHHRLQHCPLTDSAHSCPKGKRDGASLPLLLIYILRCTSTWGGMVLHRHYYQHRLASFIPTTNMSTHCGQQRCNVLHDICLTTSTNTHVVCLHRYKQPLSSVIPTPNTFCIKICLQLRWTG